ncbi:MAG TPA: copper amine oxidase N-terminal domain-containing protein [Clostridiaceae bacterium]|nr:copper amine oxidase N-terminal domain-containing protein [Clostridiaceae bacterium]
MKKFLSGLLIGAILMLTITTFAAGKIKEAFFNDTIKLEVDGKTVNTDMVTVILEGSVDGTNYVSARALAEALGAKVEWDGKNKKILVTSKDKDTTPVTTGYSYSNPAPLNTTQVIEVEDLLQKYKVEMSVKEIVRGEEAWKMVQEANMFNDPAPEGCEYLLAKIYFKLLDIDEGKQFNLTGEVDIDLVSSDGKDYDFTFAVAPEPQLRASLYKGASHEGWAVYEVRKDDAKPKLVFGRKYDGSGGIWFKAYKD